MKVESKHCIELSESERLDVITTAREIDESISSQEYVDQIESMLQAALELGIKIGKS